MLNSIIQIVSDALSMDIQILTPALRVIGGICTGNDYHTSTLITLNILNVFDAILGHSEPSVRKEIYFALSNIAAGNCGHANAMLNHAVIRKVLAGFTEQQHEIKLETVFVIRNLSKTLDENTDILKLLAHNFFYHANFLLSEQILEPKILIKTLKIIFSLCKAGSLEHVPEENPVWQALEDSGCLDVIERLQHY